MSTKYFSKMRRQVRQLRVALDQFERTINTLESLLKEVTNTIHVSSNSTEVMCLSITLRKDSRKVCWVISVDGLVNLEREIRLKITLFQASSHGDFDRGRSVSLQNLQRIFRETHQELERID